MIAVMLMACNDGSDGNDGNNDSEAPEDTGEAPGDTGDEATDLLRAALGGCTAVNEGVVERGPYSTAAIAYNADGDATTKVVTYATGGEAYTYTWEWGAPHQQSSLRTRVPGNPSDDLLTYVWEGGHITEVHTDYGADGVVEEIELRGNTTEGLWASNDWDYDADGVSDDHIGYTWEPDGEGWQGTGEGLDPYGTYGTDIWADATARIYHYSYTDDRGVAYEWELSEEANVLGFSALNIERMSIPGEYEWLENDDTTFDDLGRIAGSAYSYERTDEGSPSTTLEVAHTWTYDCP